VEPSPLPSPATEAPVQEAAPVPESSPEPSPEPPAAAEAAAAATPSEEKPPPCTEEEPCLGAERQERLTRDHGRFTGFVDLRFGDSRIQADELDFFRRQKPDGSEYNEIVASGNVVFLRGEERLAGERLTMDLSSGQGSFENALGYVSPGVFVEAKKVVRDDARTYRIEGGRFTSCAQPTPRWSFQASSATLKVEDRITAHNVVFKVKQVPAFYVPYFTYPIQEDQRSTGLLFPHFGFSSERGVNIGGGFFWAMGRSFDQTLYLDYYSDFGQGYGHEFRYLLRPQARGTFRTYVFQRPQGAWEYDVNWNAAQPLPGGGQARLNVVASSDLLFQQQIQDSLDQAFRRTRRATLNLQRGFRRTTARVLLESAETFFPSGVLVNKDIRRHLPTLRVNMAPTKQRRTGLVFTYEAAAENLARGNQDRVDTYGRFDLLPRLSRPFSTTFLQLNPEIALRWTRYGASVVEGVVDGPPVDRRYAEARVELRGPTFSRVFVTPGNFYSERYKHVIGPEVAWTYRSPVDDFTAIPIFDGNDRLLGTNQIDYGLVQRFYAKRNNAAGKAEPYEFLNWRIYQTYYVQIRDKQNEFDPNFTTGFFGPGGVPDHNSPVRSRLEFRPTPGASSTFDVEYDVNFKQLRNLTLGAAADFDRFGFLANWSRAERVAVQEANRGRTRDTLRGSARLKVLPGRLALEGSADYDILGRTLRQRAARVRYDVQCCGFQVEFIRSDFNLRQERQFRFAIELANLGSIGNFMGPEPSATRR
jgi:LPS-assembly protein